jgi:hypothetical protein
MTKMINIKMNKINYKMMKMIKIINNQTIKNKMKIINK